MNKRLCFDDVLIEPRFSMVRSRSDVSLEQEFLGRKYSLPIMSANMDTVTGSTMAKEMHFNGGIGVIHRFSDRLDTIKMFEKSDRTAYISFGIGSLELERAKCLEMEGATHFVLDVAHAASIQVVEQYDLVRKLLGNSVYIIVGNFASKQDIEAFNYHSKTKKPDAYKVGIGGGSACTTRIVTGCGVPTLASVIDCVKTRLPIIADGGMRTSGDVAKALAAGARMVMLGGMLAGTKESAGVQTYVDTLKTLHNWEDHYGRDPIEWLEIQRRDIPYRGSASKESYEVQGKVASHRTPEGASFTVKYKGPVSNVLQDISAGIKSAMAYTNSFNLQEFRENAILIQVSTASISENSAHGDKK